MFDPKVVKKPPCIIHTVKKSVMDRPPAMLVVAVLRSQWARECLILPL